MSLQGFREREESFPVPSGNVVRNWTWGSLYSRGSSEQWVFHQGLPQPSCLGSLSTGDAADGILRKAKEESSDQSVEAGRWAGIVVRLQRQHPGFPAPYPHFKLTPNWLYFCSGEKEMESRLVELHLLCSCVAADAWKRTFAPGAWASTFGTSCKQPNTVTAQKPKRRGWNIQLLHVGLHDQRGSKKHIWFSDANLFRTFQIRDYFFYPVTEGHLQTGSWHPQGYPVYLADCSPLWQCRLPDAFLRTWRTLGLSQTERDMVQLETIFENPLSIHK